MSRTLHRLSAARARTAPAGHYADGGNLWLQVVETSTGQLGRSWYFRYARPDGTRASNSNYRRERSMGLGPLHTIDLATARELARQARALLLQGIDPLEARDVRRAEQRTSALKTSVTFAECSAKYISAKEPEWSNAEHRRQWVTSIAQDVNPAIGNLPVASVDTSIVMRVLEPIWHEKPETAGRIRGRIELILDWAKTRGYRDGENPAKWKGHLENLLPKRDRSAQKHLAALPPREVPALVAALRARGGDLAAVLELAILCGSRIGEVLGARWDEIDLDRAVWVVPPERMKARREHRVVLSTRAVDLLKPRRTKAKGPRAFPVFQPKDVRRFLHSTGIKDATVHGLRASFRTWGAEQTSYPPEMFEIALSHAVGDAIERAYQRSDLLDRRRQMMEDWAVFCGGRSNG
jgi:integrase